MLRIALILSPVFLVLVLQVIILYPSSAQPIDSSPPIPSSFSNSSYVNTTLGIQVRIPPNWVDENVATDDGWKGVNFTSLDNRSFFVVNVTDNRNDNRSVSQLVDSLKGSIQNVTQEDLIIFAGLPAYQITSWKQVPDSEKGGEDIRLNVTDIVTNSNNKTYHIKYGAEANESQAFSEFKNILATFKIDDGNIGNERSSQRLSSFIPQQSTLLPPQQTMMPQPPMQQQQTIPPPPASIPFNPLPQNPPIPLAPIQPPLQQPIQSPPRILSHSSYIGSTGTMHVVGEVMNESSRPMYFVKITATFYDTTNRVIGTESSYADPDTLQPGQRAPFDIMVFRGSIPMHLVATYTLAADYSDFSIFR